MPTWSGSRARRSRARTALANELPHGRSARAVSLSAVTARPGTLAGLAVAGVVLLAVAIRIWLTRRIPAPWIMGDELIYSSFAKSFSEHHHMTFRLQPWPFLSIYPAVVSPAWLAGSIDSTYAIAKAMNAVLMSLVAIPLYVWARRLVSPVYAVLVVVLVLLMPVFVYVNELMTESLAFPAILLALLAMALALERPTIPRQAFAVAAILLASATRLQALVLFLVLPTAIVLKVLLDARAAPPPSLARSLPRAIVRYGFTFVLLFGGAVVYAGYKHAQGRSVHEILGAYSGVETSGYYKFEAVARWMALHIAELQYSVGLLPASALIVLLGLAWRRGASTTPAERAFLAVVMAATPWLIFEVAAFASRYSQRIEERNMFYLGPLFLLALVVWLDKGMPRPTGLTAAAAVIPAGMLVLLPIEGLLNVSIMSDTFAFIPLVRVSNLFDGGTTDMRILLGLGAIAVVLVFVCLPRRLAMFAIPLGVAAFLALSSYSVLGTVRVQSLAALQSQGVAPNDVSWVDERVGTDAHVVFVNNISLAENPHTLWQTEFWNRSIESVVDLAQPPHVMLGREGTIDPQTGQIVTSDPFVAASVRRSPYAVAPTSLEIAGEVIAKPGSFLALYRVDRPLRLARKVSGLYSDGWTAGDMALSQYATPGQRSGNLVVRMVRPTLVRDGLLGAARATLELGRLRVSDEGAVETGGRVVRRSIRLAENRPVVVRLPTPKPPFLFQLHVTPTFRPVDIGLEDVRELGIQLSSRFVPKGVSTAR
jgi:hypothetical protein